MYRIRATRYDDKIILRSGDMSKVIKMPTPFALTTSNPEELEMEWACLFKRKCTEIIRDRLYRRHGGNWRSAWQGNQALISTISAWKRMQPVKARGEE